MTRKLTGETIKTIAGELNVSTRFVCDNCEEELDEDTYHNCGYTTEGLGDDSAFEGYFAIAQSVVDCPYCQDGTYMKTIDAEWHLAQHDRYLDLMFHLDFQPKAETLAMAQRMNYYIQVRYFDNCGCSDKTRDHLLVPGNTQETDALLSFLNDCVAIVRTQLPHIEISDARACSIYPGDFLIDVNGMEYAHSLQIERRGDIQTFGIYIADPERLRVRNEHGLYARTIMQSPLVGVGDTPGKPL